MHHTTRTALFLILSFLSVSSAQYIETTIVVGKAPQALAYDSVNCKLYVASEGSNAVFVIDTRTNQVRKRIAVGPNPCALCWNYKAGKIYCANNDLNNPGTVSVISTASDSVIATITVARNPSGLVYNAQRNKVYCSNRGSFSVTSIDAQNDRVLSTISVSQNPNEILYHPTSDRVYTTGGAYGQPGKIHVIDCATDRLVATVSSGVNAWAMSANTLNNRLYVANAGSDNLTVLNCANNQVLATIPVGSEPHCVLWTVHNKVFCGAYWDELLRFMPGESLRFKGMVTLSGKPERMLYNPVTQRLYVSCPLETRVIVLDARNGMEQVITSLTTGGGPKAMVFCPVSERIYVANSWDSTLTVIRDRSGIQENPSGYSSFCRLTPNPARNSVFLTAPAALPLYDRSGVFVRLLSPGPNSLSGLKPGVYFLPVSSHLPALKLIISR